ncbi:MAG: hypothetical protein ACYS26_15040 [Planctomycetota bacterium]|jgi:hypothetical protein
MPPWRGALSELEERFRWRREAWARRKQLIAEIDRLERERAELEVAWLEVAELRPIQAWWRRLNGWLHMRPKVEAEPAEVERLVADRLREIEERDAELEALEVSLAEVERTRDQDEADLNEWRALAREWIAQHEPDKAMRLRGLDIQLAELEGQDVVLRRSRRDLNRALSVIQQLNSQSSARQVSRNASEPHAEGLGAAIALNTALGAPYSTAGGSNARRRMRQAAAAASRIERLTPQLERELRLTGQRLLELNAAYPAVLGPNPAGEDLYADTADAIERWATLKPGQMASALVSSDHDLLRRLDGRLGQAAVECSAERERIAEGLERELLG